MQHRLRQHQLLLKYGSHLYNRESIVLLYNLFLLRNYININNSWWKWALTDSSCKSIKVIIYLFSRNVKSFAFKKMNFLHVNNIFRSGWKIFSFELEAIINKTWNKIYIKNIFNFLLLNFKYIPKKIPRFLFTLQKSRKVAFKK